ncbi:MAG: hypothetical protein U0441_11820 [Polyangiaceae bacterium]
MSIDVFATPSLARLTDELHSAPPPAIPALFCPFEPGIHADVDAIQTASERFAERHGLVSGERAARKLHASKIATLVCRAHPNGRADALRIAADWTTLFCLLDDHIERLESPIAAREYLFELLAVARGVARFTKDPARSAMAELRERLIEIASPAAFSRVEDRIAELFHMFCREAVVRASGEIPSLTAYVPMREVTVGIPVLLAIGEIVDDATLPDAARSLGPVQAAARMACNLVGWSNDVYTFEKELRDREPCNLVAVVARARRLPLHEAVAFAAAMHDAEARRLAALLDELALLGEEVARYADMLRSWVRGHLDWGRETGRYAPGRAP